MTSWQNVKNRERQEKSFVATGNSTTTLVKGWKSYVPGMMNKGPITSPSPLDIHLGPENLQALLQRPESCPFHKAQGLSIPSYKSQNDASPNRVRTKEQ